MKCAAKPGLLKFFTLSAGLLGLVLRITLYATAVDHKGLLQSGHWANIATWVLTGLVLVMIVALTRSVRGSNDYRDAHPASVGAALGCLALAAAILVGAVKSLGNPPADIAALAGLVLSFLAAISLLCICACRVAGSRAFFLFHALISVFFAVRMVGQYQQWSSDPQLLDYAFCLSAFVALMLTAYHQAAFDADMGNHRALWTLSLISLFLCIAATRTRDDLWLLAAGFWALTNMTSLQIRPRGRFAQDRRQEKA